MDSAQDTPGTAAPCPTWCTSDHEVEPRHIGSLAAAGGNDGAVVGTRLTTDNDGSEPTIHLIIWPDGQNILALAKVELTEAQAHRVAAQLLAAAREAVR